MSSIKTGLRTCLIEFVTCVVSCSACVHVYVHVFLCQCVSVPVCFLCRLVCQFYYIYFIYPYRFLNYPYILMYHNVLKVIDN